MSNSMPSKLKKQVLQYTTVFEKDPDIGGYTATIPALPGCISEGSTLAQASKNIREAAELYLEVAMQKRKHKSIKDRKVIVKPIKVAL